MYVLIEEHRRKYCVIEAGLKVGVCIFLANNGVLGNFGLCAHPASPLFTARS